MARFPEGKCKVFLHGLSKEDIEEFWKKSREGQKLILKSKTNWHHRNPLARGGDDTSSNGSLVVMERHAIFNKLVELAKEMQGIKVGKKVNSQHIAWAMQRVYNKIDFYPEIGVLFRDTEGALLSPEEIVIYMASCWLPPGAGLKVKKSPIDGAVTFNASNTV